MRKWLNVLLALMMTVMCFTTTVLPACAAELPEVSVPVTISLFGTLPYPAEDYMVELKPDSAEYPMPEGTVNGIYSMTITGADTKSFPAIIYDQVGIYTYTIYQVPGSNAKCTYDSTVYALTVTITNKKNFSGLEATAALRPLPNGEKVPAAEFENSYPIELPMDSPATGDESSPMLYAALIAVSMGVLVTLFFTGKRKKIEE